MARLPIRLTGPAIEELERTFKEFADRSAVPPVYVPGDNLDSAMGA
jgi:hypothetical protein